MVEVPPIDFDDVERRATLPQLAWALTLRGTTATLTAGSGVEIGEGTCFEGIWSSKSLDVRSLARPDRRAAVYFFGSAAIRLSPSEVLCIPPTQTIDGLYLVLPHNGSRVIVTNSVVWAMREAGVSGLKPGEVDALTEALQSSTAGLLGYRRLLLQTRSASLVRIMYTSFVVDAVRGAFSEDLVGFVRETEPFTFAGYKEALLSVLESAWRNGNAKGRRHRFVRMHSTMSSGYDGTACAALAKELGFTEVISLDSGRGGSDDSGRLAGAQMGMKVRLYPRPGNGLEYRSEKVPDYFLDVATLRQETGKSYAEFIAPLSNYGDLIFDAFEPELPGTVLLTGFHAGQVWSYGCPSGPWIKRSDASGSGLNEFRLRTGFVHVPVGFIHCLQWKSIQKLSQSPEMRPYNFGNPYNKPIARRLGEEAGASRESFGVRKRAANVMLLLGAEAFAPYYEEIAARYD